MIELSSFTVELSGKALFPNISIQVNGGDVLTIMGPSGAGKSSLLNGILGMLAPAFNLQGDVSLDGQSIKQLPTEQRHLGLVAQDDWLFPHMTVEQNLNFAVPKSVKKPQAKQQIDSMLARAGLSEHIHKRPKQLSGGQRQRIAVLGMLLSQPKAVLLDEPFSKLDQQLRADFRSWCFDFIAEQNLPAILVTHDPQDLPNPEFWQLDQGVLKNA